MRFSSIIKFSVAFLLGGAIVVQSYKAFTSASGPGGGYTNAPGESNCTSCHTGSLNTPGSSLTVSNGQSAFEYLPDSTYTITVKFSSSGATRAGFEVTSLLASNNNMVGTFSTTSSATQITTATISSKTRYYVEHTGSGIYFSSGDPTWTMKWKAPSSNMGNIIFYVVVNMTNSDGTDAGDKIYAATYTMKPSSKLPVASFSYSPSPPCQGDSVHFYGSSTNNATSYTWTFTGGNISSSTAKNPTVYFGNYGMKTISLSTSNAFGKSQTVSKQVFVSAKPSDTIGIKGPNPFCKGYPITLTATAGSKYLWSTGDSTQSISVKDSGYYYVTVTSQGGCTTKSKTVHVGMLASPLAVLKSNAVNDSLCKGDDLVLTADTGASKYVFYQNSNIISSSASNIAIVSNLVGVNNKFYVVAFNANGCTDTSATIKVAVKPRLTAPVLSKGSSTTSSVSLSWTAVSGATGYEVSEDSGKTWKTPSAGSKGLSHTATGLNYSQSIAMQVRAMGYSTSCPTGNISSIVLNTLSCSGITYDLSADTAICEGDSANIIFSNISSPQYGISLNKGPAEKLTQWRFKPVKDTALQFTIYDSAKLNCPPIALNIKIAVSPLPVVVYKTFPFGKICEGKTFTAVATSGYSRYVFYVNNEKMQDSSIESYVYTAGNGHASADTLGVEAYNSKGCVSGRQLLPVSINPAPHGGFYYKADKLNVSFYDTTQDGSTRTWYFGDKSSDTATTITHGYLEKGTYTISMVSRNKYGCTDSIVKTITVSDVGIPVASLMESVSVSPNPFHDRLYMRFNTLATGNVEIQFTDMLGRTVMPPLKLLLNQGFNEFSISTADLPGGTYFLMISDGSQWKIQKMVKLKDR